MENELDDLIGNHGVTRVMSGMALGVDIWCCEIMIERMKNNAALELECVLPFIGQNEKWTKANIKQYGSRYDAIVNSEKTIKEYTPDAEYVGSASYNRRNRYMAERCDFLLAVWDGKPSGTGNTVSMARELGKTCIIIDPSRFLHLTDSEKK